jgi:hypothetical protein
MPRVESLPPVEVTLRLWSGMSRTVKVPRFLVDGTAFRSLEWEVNARLRAAAPPETSRGKDRKR